LTLERGPTPTALQTLILWALVSQGGTARQKDLRPEPKKADRDALERARLVSVDKKRRPLHVELTDRGWAWAAANTTAALPARSSNGTVVLAALLARLGAYMAAADVALADIINPANPAPGSQHDTKQELGLRIRAAYLAESGGVVNQRVRLAAIRARLADVGRAELDGALVALELGGDGGLLALDDPTEIGPADRAAALQVGVQARHLLWLDR